MPKQADIRVQVPGCAAARFWDVVYERPEATERYHTSFNASTYTTVTPWSACQRTVNFAMPLKLPDFVKRMVGLDSVAVSEVQRVVWHGGGSFTVTSETQIANMMGAGRFTTALQLSVNEEPEQHLSPPPPMQRHHQPQHPPQQQQQQSASMQVARADGEHQEAPAPAAAASATSAAVGVPVADAPSSPSHHHPHQDDVATVAGVAAAVERHLQLVYSVRCAASSMPWPMSATIENLMAEKALVSMQNFLDFCKQLLDEHAATATAAAPPSASGSAVGAGGAPETAAAAAGGHMSSPTPSCTAGGPLPLSPPLNARGAAASCLRQRWPSITCSQDIGGGDMGGLRVRLSSLATAGGEEASFHLGRQDTLGSGGGDVFWDAPEAFVGGSSGASSGVVSPRHLPLGHLQLPPAALRHTSGNGMVGPAGQGGCGAGVPAPAAAGVAVGTAPAETHHLDVAVDHLSAAVAALDRKVEKALQMLQQQQEFQQQLQSQAADATANLSVRSNNNAGGGAAGGARYRRCHRRGIIGGTRGGDRGGGGSDDDDDVEGEPGGGSGSDLRWFLRVTIALLLATVVVVGFWLLRLHVTGLRPHSGGGGGGGDPPGLLHQPSVLRLSGEEYLRLGDKAVAAVGKVAPEGGGGGGMVRSARRMAFSSGGGGGGTTSGAAGASGGRGGFTDGARGGSNSIGHLGDEALKRGRRRRC